MFRNCSSLTSLDISNININNVKDINDMFYGCSSLSTLNLSNFNDNDVKNTKEILNNLNSKCIIITKNNEMLRPFKK
jgi:surface protein